MYHRCRRSQEVIRHSHRFYQEHLATYDTIGIRSMTNYPPPPPLKVEILDPPLSQIVFRPKAKSDFYLFESPLPVHTSTMLVFFVFVLKCIWVNTIIQIVKNIFYNFFGILSRFAPVFCANIFQIFFQIDNLYRI